MTTNRIGVIDEAFMSRIHVSFGFPDLTDEDRERIWVNNFERLKATTNIKVSPSALTYVKTAAVTKLKWNGRHIRNGEIIQEALRSNTADLSLCSISDRRRLC